MNLSAQDFCLRAYLLGPAADPGPRSGRGTWSVQRQLLDRAAGTRGTFSGVVHFSPTDDGGLAFREEGTVHWPAFTGPATRDYLLRPSGQPSTLDVVFADGRPFHRMGFAPGAAHDKHWCDPDTYRVAYSHEGPDRFSYTWDVTGPRKDLLLSSRLHRVPGARDLACAPIRG